MLKNLNLLRAIARGIDEFELGEVDAVRADIRESWRIEGESRLDCFRLVADDFLARNAVREYPCRPE